MTDEDEESEPAVELGDGQPVEGAPIARVISRLTWPQEASRVRQKEGDSTVRTPTGPRELAEIVDEADETYFASKQEFREAVESVIGTGPVETAE
jgi:hypothetical protein